MQTWLAKILEQIGVDSIRGLKNWIGAMAKRFVQLQNQKKTAAAVDADQGKPRTEEVKQHEADDLNS